MVRDGFRVGFRVRARARARARLSGDGLDFWEVGEVRKAAIICLRCREEVELDLQPNEGVYKTHRLPSYDLGTPDALENRIGPSVQYF